MLRKMARDDVPAMLVIEQAAQGAPWTEDTFKICFEQNFEGWVLEIDEQIAGYIVLGMQADECHILNLCIARKFQRQGHGRTLLEYGMREAKQRGIAIAYLEVRRSNSRAINLYSKLHFRMIGERRDYYQTVNGPEDALIFAVSLKEITV